MSLQQSQNVLKKLCFNQGSVPWFAHSYAYVMGEAAGMMAVTQKQSWSVKVSSERAGLGKDFNLRRLKKRGERRGEERRGEERSKNAVEENRGGSKKSPALD